MNSELVTIIPKHVQEFIQHNDTVSKGLAVIERLESEDDFIQADLKLEATEKTAAILRGFLYMHYQGLSDGRTFSSFLAKRGVSRSTAYDYMDEAAIYAELPSADMCATVSQLGHMKVRQLKALSKEERDNFFAGEALNGVSLEDASGMTKDEFKQFIRDYKHSTSAELIQANKEKEEYKMRLETAESELELQKLLADEKYADVDLPDWVIAIREEAAVHGEMALRHVSGLEKALTVLKEYDQISHDSPAKFAEYRAAASVAFYQIANLVVQSTNALKHAQTFLGNDEVGEFDMSLPLTEAEAKQVVEITTMLNEKINQQESLRVGARIAKQGRVGAPKKNPKAYEDEL